MRRRIAQILKNWIQMIVCFFHGPLGSGQSHKAMKLRNLAVTFRERLTSKLTETKKDDSIDKFGDFRAINDTSWSVLKEATVYSEDTKVLIRVYEKTVVKTMDFIDVIRQEELLCFSFNHWLYPVARSFFDDSTNFYLVYSHHGNGVSLKDCLACYDQGNGLPETVCRFISAQVLMALDYLHRANVLMRDIHVENIMVNEKGYIKIISFNQSTILEEDKFISHETRGRIFFLSPEFIEANIWTMESDFWAFGIFLHHLATGSTPFQSSRGLLNTLVKIIKDCPIFSLTGSYYLEELVKNLLRNDLLQRYKAGEIFRHRWYSRINFRRLDEQSLRAPFQLREFLRFMFKKSGSKSLSLSAQNKSNEV